MNKSPFHHDSSRDAECQKYARLLGAYLDGELDAPKTLEIEGHVLRCETCHERIELDRATRGTLKKVVRQRQEEDGAHDGDANAAMRARMLAAMNAEGQRGAARKAHDDGPSKILGWRTLVPMTSAAALAIIWGSVAHAPTRQLTAGESDNGDNGAVKAAGLANDPLASFMEMHRHPLPLERTDPQGVRAFEKYVGVRVQPPTFSKEGGHLMGGRLLPINDERAALLEYHIGQEPGARRVSVFIYDPRKIQVGGADLQPLAVGTAQVRVGRANGYSVAVTQHDGVGYALASDFDQAHSAELAAMADSD